MWMEKYVQWLRALANPLMQIRILFLCHIGMKQYSLLTNCTHRLYCMLQHDVGSTDHLCSLSPKKIRDDPHLVLRQEQTHSFIWWAILDLTTQQNLPTDGDVGWESSPPSPSPRHAICRLTHTLLYVFSLPTDLAITLHVRLSVPTSGLPRSANILFVQPVHTNVAYITIVFFVFSNSFLALTIWCMCPTFEVGYAGHRCTHYLSWYFSCVSSLYPALPSFCLQPQLPVSEAWFLCSFGCTHQAVFHRDWVSKQFLKMISCFGENLIFALSFMLPFMRAWHFVPIFTFAVPTLLSSLFLGSCLFAFTGKLCLVS